MDGGILGHGNDPAQGPRRALAVGQLADFDDIGLAFEDPVPARQAHIDDAARHVLGDFLRPEHQARKLGIVDVGHVRARREPHPIASADKQVKRGLLQAPGRKADLQFFGIYIHAYAVYLSMK